MLQVGDVGGRGCRGPMLVQGGSSQVRFYKKRFLILTVIKVGECIEDGDRGGKKDGKERISLDINRSGFLLLLPRSLHPLVHSPEWATVELVGSSDKEQASAELLQHDDTLAFVHTSKDNGDSVTFLMCPEKKFLEVPGAAAFTVRTSLTSFWARVIRVPPFLAPPLSPRIENWGSFGSFSPMSGHHPLCLRSFLKHTRGERSSEGYPSH